ncbi:hypothetical protein QFZ66_000003 [Streptomyces sp. B4I13]|nr:hypothetical protein [Streptomyces sp. B4I13]
MGVRVRRDVSGLDVLTDHRQWCTAAGTGEVGAGPEHGAAHPEPGQPHNRVELCFSPAYASWANPIGAHFGLLRQFTIANSNHRNHTVQTRALHACLRRRNANARHCDVLAAQRRERARIRSERGIRRGGRPLADAA